MTIVSLRRRGDVFEDQLRGAATAGAPPSEILRSAQDDFWFSPTFSIFRLF
mgnify:CR=1 FL=1